MVPSIEDQVQWISDCLSDLSRTNIQTMEANASRAEEWIAHVNDAASSTLFPRAASWYSGANVPGKPRVFLPYVGGGPAYRAGLEAARESGYADFILSYAQLADGAADLAAAK